jgi:hypothetical protein
LGEYPNFPLHLVVSPMFVAAEESEKEREESWNNIEAVVLGAF